MQRIDKNHVNSFQKQRFGLLISFIFFGYLSNLCLSADARPESCNPQMFSHNDYAQKKPLLEALSYGFCTVEVDVFLKEGKLYVAHFSIGLKKSRTLKSLYLDPLKKIVNQQGSVFKKNEMFRVMIDIKTNSTKTIRTLRREIKQFPELIAGEKPPVHFFVSGNQDKDLLNKIPFLGIDGRLGDLGKRYSSEKMPVISENWSNHFKFRGFGTMKKSEIQKLKTMVEKAHSEGKLLRFWNTPQSLGRSEKMWNTLLINGVDLLITDNLKRLHNFFLMQKNSDN